MIKIVFFYIEAFEKISQHHLNLEDNFSFVKNSQFLNFKKLKNYPCIILTGINYTEFFYGLKKNIVLQFIYIMISLVFCILILFYYSYKKQCSFFSFQAITKNYYFQFSVESILDHIKGFTSFSEPNFIEKREVHPLSAPIRTESFISDCLLLLDDKIYKYKVKIETNLKKDQLIEKHHFPLQQIFLGLLSFSLEHNKGKNILITSHSDDNFLYLKIDDSTFFLSEPLREQLSKQLKENNLFVLNFKSIKEMANSLGIKISIQEKPTTGNVILISIPLNLKDEIKEIPHNIINFEKVKTLKS